MIPKQQRSEPAEGAFPSQSGRAPGGRMLFTDLDSDDVRLIGAVDLEWLQTRQPLPNCLALVPQLGRRR
jgi:hypothetical protein